MFMCGEIKANVSVSTSFMHLAPSLPGVDWDNISPQLLQLVENHKPLTSTNLWPQSNWEPNQRLFIICICFLNVVLLSICGIAHTTLICKNKLVKLDLVHYILYLFEKGTSEFTAILLLLLSMDTTPPPRFPALPFTLMRSCRNCSWRF